MRVTVIQRPTTEPLSLADAKAHLRVDHSDEDSLISSLITAAREWAESYTNRAIGLQLIEKSFRRFPTSYLGKIELPRPVLRSLVNVYYVDLQGVEQTVDSSVYRVIDASDSQPAILELRPGEIWPIPIYRSARAGFVRYWAGYDTTGSPADIVPESIVQAIKMVIGDLYEHREANLDADTYENRAVAALLAPWRVYTL